MSDTDAATQAVLTQLTANVSALVQGMSTINLQLAAFNPTAITAQLAQISADLTALQATVRKLQP